MRAFSHQLLALNTIIVVQLYSCSKQYYCSGTAVFYHGKKIIQYRRVPGPGVQRPLLGAVLIEVNWSEPLDGTHRNRGTHGTHKFQPYSTHVTWITQYCKQKTLRVTSFIQYFYLLKMSVEMTKRK